MKPAGAFALADEPANRVALDTLFRTHAKERPAAIAIADPADRERMTGGAARRLSYADADAAVDRLARQFRSFGLPGFSVIAIQLPNVSEAVVTILAAIRAGLVPAPLPMPWGRSELVSALAAIDAKGLVTITRFGDERPAEIACEVAAELFGLSFPCAFGAGAPDGVVALELNSGAGESEAASSEALAVGADQVAIATIDAASRGYFAVGRSHAEWIAAARAVVAEARIEPGDSIVSMLAPASLAGIAAAFVPWLLSGGTLELVHGGGRDEIARSAGERRHLVAPAAALSRLVRDVGQSFASCIAVHRGVETRALDFSAWPATIVDLTTFGEVGAVALAREVPAHARPVPLGQIRAASSRSSPPVLIETMRRPDGTLFLRGAMVPKHPFPAVVPVDAPRLRSDLDGYVRTGFRCRPDDGGGLILEENPKGIATVGGVRFGLEELAARIARTVSGLKVEKVADPLLGERLRIETEDATAADLLAWAGFSRLVVDAVVRAGIRRATA
jgi:hypothetical protein